MQRDILNQDEIDVLLRHQLGEEPQENTAEAFDPSVATPYDFTGHGVLAWGEIPAVDIIYNRFSRLLSQTLSAYIGRLVDVELISTDSLTFGDFIRTLPLPASLHLYTMRPLHGGAVMALDSTLVFCIVECLFGGSGRSRIKVEGREFTAIEQRVIAKVVLLALTELEKAWEPVYALKMRLERSEVNPHLIAIIPVRDMVLVGTLEVRLEDISAFLRLCVPYGLLQPIKNTLDGSSHSTWVDVDQNWTGLLRQELLKADVELVVELGETSIDAQQFLSCRVGDIIPLRHSVHEPLLVKIQQVPKARALPGTLHGYRAIKLSSLISQETS